MTETTGHEKVPPASPMTHAAWRGVGLILLVLGVVVALLGAARLSPEWPPLSTSLPSVVTMAASAPGRF